MSFYLGSKNKKTIMSKKKITFLGPESRSFFGVQTIGGATILFDNIKQNIDSNYHLININGRSKWFFKKIIFNVYIFLKYLQSSTRQNVFFVAHRQAIIFMFIDIVLNRKSIFRLFGGNFEYWFSNTIYKWILKKSSRRSIIICELPKDVVFFKKMNFKCFLQENFREIKKNNDEKFYYKIKNKPLTIGYLGRICNDKGVQEFIHLSKQNPSYKFILGGPFESKRAELKLIQLINKQENLNYTGIIKNVKLKGFFDKIDLLFFHSNHMGEGKPGIFVESLLHKTPILTNYHITCNNWKPFYDSGNIIKCKGDYKSYNESLKSFKSNQIIFNNKNLTPFSLKICIRQIYKYLEWI
ncbi:MAG: hypothetical protein CBC40_04490 [bacterium TMED80]|nr:MAG: hypothetical protein CBC40_04490 [bacterium TMED80]